MHNGGPLRASEGGVVEAITSLIAGFLNARPHAKRLPGLCTPAGRGWSATVRVVLVR